MIKIWKKLQKKISYNLQFINGVRFIKCKLGHDDKKCKTWGMKYKYCDCLFKCANFKCDLINTNVSVVIKVIKESLTES